MNLFIILGVVVSVTVLVLGMLIYILRKEGQENEEKAVPVTDLEKLKRDLYPGAISLAPQSSPSAQSTQAEPSMDDTASKKRVQELENELLAISKKAAGQSDEAKRMIETLTKDNEILKNQQADFEQSQKKIIALQGEASSLRIENGNLQKQLESTNVKVQILENEITAVKIQMGEELSRANETVSELNRSKEALVSAFKTESEDALRQELESLKYELVKVRAQSSGLERVSFNYKNQLEDLLKKMNAMQESNDNLSQVKDQLEGLVRELKSQNEELVKKDQLAQFEFEKNRARLVSLEREYEDFKARTQQKDPQL
jgi:chromosome segregation ATPase